MTNKSDIDLIKQAHEELKPQRGHCDFFEYFTKVVERAAQLQAEKNQLEKEYERATEHLSI